ncbi:MAG TPA: M20/M25/M40 family metallo-hydrolase [Terriglobales bacterium]|nr:M20/M25/M40 family metallo-hydrolase [Terriglobales bacterium]
MKIVWSAAFAAMLFTSTNAYAQTDAERVMAEAAKPSALEHNLEVLTDEIGGRVPGTPAMQKALDWGMNAFKAAGGENVHLESFTIPQSWAEGATRISVTRPVNFRVRGVSLAWSPATKGVLRARVVDVGEGSAQEIARAGNLEGAVLLVHSGVLHSWDDLFQEYLKAPPIIAAAIKGKAAAIAFMATREHDILYRHINNQFGTIEKLPMVLLAREDAERIARLAKAGAVQMELDVPNRVGGPIESSNVVAELRGSEKPNEFVVLGAHLDSWELGTGALDDGCNAALVIDALRGIKNSGIAPKRSIRFLLFSGEEQGTLGSWDYVRAHRAELGDAVAALVFDEGTGATTGFSLGGRKDLVSPSRELVAPFKPWSADQLTTDAFVGTDNFDFLLEGVPTFVANQKEANYMENYHATSDTFDKVDLPQLKKHVAIAATLALEIANRPERIGPRQSRAEVEQLMRETHLDDELKTFDMWRDWKSGKRGRQ